MNQLIEISAIFNDFSDLFLSGLLIYISRIMCISIFIARTVKIYSIIIYNNIYNNINYIFNCL